MADKKPSDQKYRINQTEGTHVVMSKETDGAVRAMEFTDEGNKLVGPAELIPAEEEKPEIRYVRVRDPRPPEPTFGQQLKAQVGYEVRRSVARGLETLTDNLLDMAFSSFDSWREDRRRQKQRQLQIEHEERLARIQSQRLEAERQARKEQEAAAAAKAEAEKARKIAVARTQTVTPSSEFNEAYDGFRINMTSEEAQREFIDAYMLYMLSAKKMYKLKHATIVDEKTGKTINGEDWVQGLCQPEILASFNAILSANPMMLENWQAVALADILGRELVVNGTYVAIEAETLRHRLIGE